MKPFNKHWIDGEWLILMGFCACCALYFIEREGFSRDAGLLTVIVGPFFVYTILWVVRGTYLAAGYLLEEKREDPNEA
jgi:hypothetical protein